MKTLPDSDIQVKPTAGEIISMEESADLVRLERTIKAGLDTFLEVGNALAEIRDRKLYRVEHKTFEDYCRKRWNFSANYARRLMFAAEIVEMVPIGTKSLITTESQARELSKVAPERRAEVVAAAAKSTNGNLTANAIRAATEAVEAELGDAADQARFERVLREGPRPPILQKPMPASGAKLAKLLARRWEVFMAEIPVCAHRQVRAWLKAKLAEDSL